MTIDHGDRTECASSETIHGLKRELAVRGGLAGLDSQTPLKLISNPRRATDMAGRAQTDADEVLSTRLQAKRAVERGNAIDVNERSARCFAHRSQRLFRKIAVA